MNRRNLMSSSALVLPAVGLLAACTAANTATVDATITRVVGYIQAGVTALSSTVAIFSSQMPAATQSVVASAMNALSAAAGVVETAVDGSGGATAVATGAQGVITALQVAGDAVVAGLSVIPGASAAVGVAKLALALVPVIQQFVASILPATATVPVPTAQEGLASMLPLAQIRLGVVVK